MKVLFISNMYPSDEFPFFGTFVKNVKDELEKLDATCDVVAIDTMNGRAINKLIRYIKFYISAFVKILINEHSLIYVHFPSHSFFPVWLATRFMRQKVVINFHGGDAKLHQGRSSLFFKLKKYVNQKAIDESDLVIAPSLPFLEEIKDYYDFSQTKTLVSASGGVDIETFTTDKVFNRDKLNVGFVGRLVDVKRPIYFAECISYYFDCFGCDETDVTIVGNGPLRGEMERILRGYPVKFVDSMSQKELSNFFSTTDVVVQCSETESLGLVLIESLISKCIPLCSRNSSYQYIVGDEQMLYSDKVEFSDKLHLLSQLDPCSREYIANNVSDLTKIRFSRPKVVKELYNELSKV